AATASRTARPTPTVAAVSMAGPMATLLTTKSVKVRFSKSAPRCTLPTFGAVASSKQANVAHWPIESCVFIGWKTAGENEHKEAEIGKRGKWPVNSNVG